MNLFIFFLLLSLLGCLSSATHSMREHGENATNISRANQNDSLKQPRRIYGARENNVRLFTLSVRFLELLKSDVSCTQCFLLFRLLFRAKIARRHTNLIPFPYPATGKVRALILIRRVFMLGICKSANYLSLSM